MVQEQEEPLSVKFADAVAALRRQKPDLRRKGVESQIEKSLESIKDLLEAWDDYASWKGFHEALVAFDEGAREAPWNTQQLIDQEIVSADQQTRDLRARIQELEEEHSDELIRLRLLWTVKESKKAAMEPMVAFR